MAAEYQDDYYQDRHQQTVYAAQVVLSMVLDALPDMHSAVDFGCGVGTWLSVLREEGVSEILGLDGPWVEPQLLEIPGQCFRSINLEETVCLSRKYDLAISLEVAEHLPEATASRFVESLVNASDYILFSAAIPFQGGIGHVNDQWPNYCANRFQQHGYVPIDFVRHRIWHDEQIPWWYRQNILLFVNEQTVHRVNIPQSIDATGRLPLSAVHPALYLSHFQSS